MLSHQLALHQVILLGNLTGNQLVKPAALRAMISAKLAQKLQVDYGD